MSSLFLSRLIEHRLSGIMLFFRVAPGVSSAGRGGRLHRMLSRSKGRMRQDLVSGTQWVADLAETVERATHVSIGACLCQTSTKASRAPIPSEPESPAIAQRERTRFKYSGSFLLHFCSVYGSHGAND